MVDLVALAVDRFFAEMLCQHIIHNSTVLVALGFAVDFDHFADCFHQLWTVFQAKRFDEDVVLNCLKLRRLTTSNSLCVFVIDGRAAADCDFRQQIHIWRHVALRIQIFRVFRDPFVSLTHRVSPHLILWRIAR